MRAGIVIAALRISSPNIQPPQSFSSGNYGVAGTGWRADWVGRGVGWGVGVVAEIFLTDYSESSRPEQRFMTLPHFRCARPCSYRQKALYI